MSDDQVVRTTAEGPLWIVTLSRPKVVNAVNGLMATQLAAAINVFEEDDALRVCIIQGEGGNFCAGMDLKGFAAGDRPFLPSGGFAGLVELSLRKPIVAAVEGYALAGGFEIALCCDLIVASRSAEFGLPEARRGLVAAGGGLLRLPSLIPRALAMELALTGRSMGAEEAWRAGLLNRLVEPGRALDAARSLALEVAGNAPLAVAASKRIVKNSRTWSDLEMFACQKDLSDSVLNSADALEGARAFAEKRIPKWSGS